MSGHIVKRSCSVLGPIQEGWGVCQEGLPVRRLKTWLKTMFSKTHLKNGICLPERGHCCYRGRERAVSVLSECLKGWQVGQVDPSPAVLHLLQFQWVELRLVR